MTSTVASSARALPRLVTSPFRLFSPFPDLEVVIGAKEHGTRDASAVVRDFGGPHASINQVHGAAVTVVRACGERLADADGFATDTPGLLLTLDWADCQNFVVYAPGKRVTGLVHAGWRSLTAGILPTFFEMLQREWRIAPEETIVGAGPSLCKYCAEFTDPGRELPAAWADCTDGRCVDLAAIADGQLLALGVRRESLERHPDCPRCLPDRYWTYRGGDREAVKMGARNVLACRILNGTQDGRPAH